MSAPKPKLTLGPLLYHWVEDKWLDFYARIADEADVDCVYIGEVVCSKRDPFTEELRPKAIERLQAAGKEVVLSTLSALTTPREVEQLQEICNQTEFQVEANDISALRYLEEKRFICGPFVNVFNESALGFVINSGAVRVAFPVEISGKAIATLAKAASPVQSEVLVFGRQPLALSMRCYSARAYGSIKDNCQFVCKNDPDGMAADTIDGKPLLRINGTQTLSHGYVALMNEIDEMRKAGVSHFRLTPQDVDMVKVASIYRCVLNGKSEPEKALASLGKVIGDTPLINGYYHATDGRAFVA